MALKSSSLLSCFSAHSHRLPLARSCPSAHLRSHASHRSYAQHHASPSPHNHDLDDPTWPHASPHVVPTPYEIFRQKKGTPYSKTRFYELVKIYHPDRAHHHPAHPRSHAIRLERYRLVIAANEILSDPAKRRAYDRWGAGWAGQPIMPQERNARDPARDAGRDHPDRFYDDWTATANHATWEDWERWYRRRAGDQPQSPRYVSNERFVGIVVIFVIVGATLELSRATSLGVAYKEQVDQRHALASQHLAKRKQAQADLGGQDARVQDFLRTRDTGFRGEGVPASVKAETPRSTLPPSQTLNGGWK